MKRKPPRVKRAPGVRRHKPRHGGLRAFPCKCPEPGCTGWRGNVLTTGGDHISREQAMKSLRIDGRAYANRG